MVSPQLLLSVRTAARAPHAHRTRASPPTLARPPIARRARRRCGNVAAILELDEHLTKSFKIFEAAPSEARGVPAKKPAPDYFL